MFAVVLLAFAISEHRAVLIWQDRTPAVELFAPKGLHIESQVGPDFTTHYLIPDGEKSSSSRAGIYVGNYPSMFRKTPVTHRTGKILHKDVDWSCWRDAHETPPLICETLISNVIPDEGHPPTVLHIWVHGNSAAIVSH